MQAYSVRLPRNIIRSLRAGLKKHRAGFSGDGLTAKTIASAQHGIKNGRWPKDKIVKAAAWFARHNDNFEKETNNNSPIVTAWQLWGGAYGGRDWIDRQAKKIKAKKNPPSKPAPKAKRIIGSKVNKPGTAAAGGGIVTLSPRITEALSKKATRTADLETLKKVYRRGLGAYSKSHRPGTTRHQWAMARVNAYLTDPDYRADDDLKKGTKMIKRNPRLTAAERRALPRSQCGIVRPDGYCSYPMIDGDESMARDAIRMVRQHGNSVEKATVYAHIVKNFPELAARSEVVSAWARRNKIKITNVRKNKHVQNNPANMTAIKRSTPSRPARALKDAGLIQGRVLDYGCGFGGDLKLLGAQGYDPAFEEFSKMPRGKFDTIVCTYVLNTENPQQRAKTRADILKRLKPNGKAYLTVRADDPATETQYRVRLKDPAVIENRSFIVYELEKNRQLTKKNPAHKPEFLLLGTRIDFDLIEGNKKTETKISLDDKWALATDKNMEDIFLVVAGKPITGRKTSRENRQNFRRWTGGSTVGRTWEMKIPNGEKVGRPIGKIIRIYYDGKLQEGTEGRSRRVHEFKSEFPRLIELTDGLKISRGRSNYTVEDRGIVG